MVQNLTDDLILEDNPSEKATLPIDKSDYLALAGK
jgi:hypothetical protein